VGLAYKDNGLDAMPLAESTNDWSNGIHLSIRRVLRSAVSYFVVCCFYHKIFNSTKLLQYVALSVKLMMQRLAIWYK